MAKPDTEWFYCPTCRKKSCRRYKPFSLRFPDGTVRHWPAGIQCHRCHYRQPDMPMADYEALSPADRERINAEPR